MPKKFVQDVVPTGKRSIRNIPLPNSTAIYDRKNEPRPRVTERPTMEEELKSIQDQKAAEAKKALRAKRAASGGRGFSSIGIWAISLVVFLGLIYAGSFVFVSATVNVIPKEVNAPINLTGRAELDPSQSSLGFTTVTLTREGSKEVTSTGEETVNRKATGNVVIYNNTSTSQVLIANTRFESPDGLIYRIQDRVTVPAQKTVSGTVTPGSLNVKVTAEEAGEKYNIGLADFTIPGFKDDPRYEKIIAKSDPKTPISGGMVGTIKKVTPTDALAAKNSIETKLKIELQEALAAQIPETHILFRNATTFKFSELPQKAGQENSTTVLSESGTVYGVLFAKNELYKFLASGLGETKDKDVYVANIDSLNFNFASSTPYNPGTSKQIDFKISGNTNFVWNTESAEIAASLAGQKRSNIKDILAKFESVDQANVSIKPVWIMSLPKDPSRIEVKIEPAE